MLKDKALTRLRRDEIGFVFQSYNLVPTLTAEENILLPLAIAGRSPDRAWYDSVIATVSLADRLAPQAERALRGPAAAGRGRPGPGQPADGGLRRRADRQPRLHLGRRGARAAPPQRRRPRPDGRDGHPRPGGRRLHRPGAVPRRRPGRRRAARPDARAGARHDGPDGRPGRPDADDPGLPQEPAGPPGPAAAQHVRDRAGRRVRHRHPDVLRHPPAQLHRAVRLHRRRHGGPADEPRPRGRRPDRQHPDRARPRWSRSSRSCRARPGSTGWSARTGVYVLSTENKVVGGSGPPAFGGNWSDAPAGHGLEGLVIVEGHEPHGADEVVLDENTADRGRLRAR